jgi:hypothetical protein
MPCSIHQANRIAHSPGENVAIPGERPVLSAACTRKYANASFVQMSLLEWRTAIPDDGGASTESMDAR